MFRNILLPVDLSDRHQRAVELAADLASQAGGQLVLLHVIETIPGLAMEEERPFYNRLEKNARSHLARLGEALTTRKTMWRAEVRFGNRGPDILRCAREMQADLIVLTARPLDPEHPVAGLGSLSYKIGLFAECPVLLVK